MKKALSAAWEYIKRLDKLLLLLCIVASGFSVLLLWCLNENGISSEVSTSQYKTQLVASGIGIAVALVISAIDYRFISRMWYIYAPATVLLMLLLFTPLGITAKGSDDTGWLLIAGVSLQPSELLKIAFIMTFSTHLSKVGKKMNQLPHFILLCVHGCLPAVLIMLTGDDGTALVFMALFVVMMFAAGVSWKYIAVAAAAIPAGLYFAWNFLMQAHQKKRFLVLYDPAVRAEEPDMFYQQMRGTIALGSGELTGKGLLGGSYTSVPAIQTDFIFSYIGMTLGFVGCIATIALLAFICIKILSVGISCKDPLGRLICTGVFTMILFHTIVNIGMVLCVVPVIGIPLPFISAGGTSVVALYAAVGLVLSVYGHRDKKYHLFYTE